MILHTGFSPYLQNNPSEGDWSVIATAASPIAAFAIAPIGFPGI
jgi:hypothetical protein